MKVFLWIIALILVEILVIYNMNKYIVLGEKRLSYFLIAIVGYAALGYIILHILESVDDLNLFFTFKGLATTLIAFALGFFVFRESPPSLKQSIGIAFGVLAIFLLA
ncbi:hypothetical protein ISTM_378 [Insectomime virus]|uniref:Uncharacterized protein n=1 Tax=Tunisvirus fontaine2 TaxID=1421067 RepID=V9SGV7_9VIRU|nr:hypothetical protein D1R32_gp422 [Tunisvirus fontaine2]AHA46276.1 hypothetical protein ISTM_378 [Insectomime virus]AHC55139.1 hypothetical protein TNS_ORF421 [Tunisvirus fontaine2]